MQSTNVFSVFHWRLSLLVNAHVNGSSQLTGELQRMKRNACMEIAIGGVEAASVSVQLRRCGSIQAFIVGVTAPVLRESTHHIACVRARMTTSDRRA